MVILQLFSDKAVDWFDINDAGELQSHQHFIDLSQCPKLNVDANLIVLLPGEKVTMTSVKLPKMRASERARAIPFALEEQLATDPENIAVAIGDVMPDGTMAVAVIEAKTLEEQLKALTDAHFYPRALLPDFLALSWESETWSVLLRQQMASIRTGLQNGFSTDTNNLFLFLQLHLEKNKDKKPQKIIFWQDEAVLDVAQFEKLGVPIETRGESKSLYFDCKNLSSKPPINFLQGKYRPKTQSSSLKKNWMICGATAAALIAFLFLGHIAQWIYFQHQADSVEKQVMQTYQLLFPGAKEVLEPRFRTANLLKKYESASLGSAFIKLLGIAGKTVLTLPDIQVQLVHFENKQLALTVNAKNVDQLSQWSKALSAEGLQVSQQINKGSGTGGAVSAVITVKENA